MDAKALLRAQKAAAKVQHPYASYNASGQLRCTICAVPVKQWDAHLLTKQHRASVQREKAEEAKRAAAAAKRKQAEAPELSERSKRPRVSEPEDGPALPAGFFSSGNKPSVADEEEEEVATPATVGGKAEKEEDPELDAFLASLNDETDAPAPTAVEQAGQQKVEKKKRRAGYKEPEEGVASYAAAPVLIQRSEGGEVKEPTPEPEETEQERRERLAREEKEEIFARLEEEQRAQEDADNRVLALKARMEALKKRREAKKPKPKA